MIVSSTFLTAESLKYIFQNSIYFTAIGSLSLYKSMSKIMTTRQAGGLYEGYKPR